MSPGRKNKPETTRTAVTQNDYTVRESCTMQTLKGFKEL